jgi:hypothetical protein
MPYRLPELGYSSPADVARLTSWLFVAYSAGILLCEDTTPAVTKLMVSLDTIWLYVCCVQLATHSTHLGECCRNRCFTRRYVGAVVWVPRLYSICDGSCKHSDLDRCVRDYQPLDTANM